MVYPQLSAESTTRSSLDTPLCQPQASTSLFLPQQQPQQLLYAPYNAIPTCMPPTNQTSHHCIYANTRRNASNTVTLRNQGVKNTKWHIKSRPVRVKNTLAQPNVQHPVQYPPPLVIYDPGQNHFSAPSQATLPVYLNQASSYYNHGPYPVEYGNFNPTNVIPQSFYKPPELQTFCLIPDRQSPQNQFPQQQPPQQNYYNNVTLQKPAFPAPSALYPIGGNESRIPTVPSTQILCNPPINSNVSEKIPAAGSTDFSGMKLTENILKTETTLPGTDGTFDVGRHNSTLKYDDDSANKCSLDEMFSDEPPFDFTIEAEKMVSALCNTSELDNDEDETKAVDGQLADYPKSNDHPSNNRKPWYSDEFSSKPNLTAKSVSTQTHETLPEESQNSELMRKMIHYGCNEAETILEPITTPSARQNWLSNLSAATKIALAKSSTCFPFFSGDKIFSQDLIASFLRIGNGWLVLDYYLNKHHPTLNEKYDDTLKKSFKLWEVFTNDLLAHVIKAFVKLEANSLDTEPDNVQNSFPGDASLYVKYGLFGDPPPIPASQPSGQQSMPLFKPFIGLNPSIAYPIFENHEQKHRWSFGKESKLRTKWTITEQSRSNNYSHNLHSDKAEWKIFPQEFPVQKIPLVNQIAQQKLQYNFFMPKVEENATDRVISTVPAPSIDERLQFWNSSHQSYTQNNIFSALPCNDTTLGTLDNTKLTLLNQIEASRLTQGQKSTEGEKINLAAWFASMRNKGVDSIENTTITPSTWWGSTNQIPSKLRESSKSALDSTGPSRMDINRQLRTLKHMRTIQSAPWTANHILDDNRSNGKRAPDEYDSSEDVRVYMKPGSYNVPKKKYQSRRSHRRDSSKLRSFSRPAQSQFELENTSQDSLVPLAHSNVSSSSSSTCSPDATWKAACASAELLLGALKVNKAAKNKNSNDKIVSCTLKPPKDSEKVERWQDRTFDEHEDDSQKVCSHTASEDESEVGQPSSLDNSGVSRLKHSRTNVKTDSWLIRTLHNVSTESKDTMTSNHPTRESPKQMTSNISHTTNIVPWKPPDRDNSSEERSYCLESSHTIAVMTLVDVGKATYSETVRRFSSTSKKSSPKALLPTLQENSKIYRKSLTPIIEDGEQQEVDVGQSVKSKPDRITKAKKSKNQGGDRGWSVWYSSRRKQHNNGLGPHVLGKLVGIHRALWRMDVCCLLKCPVSYTKGSSANQYPELFNIKNYRKVTKNPMFLDTIGYKLKNHVYRKTEHAIRDFRRIVHNSKLYHQNDKDSTEKIEVLSRKLEDLVEQHFAEELQGEKDVPAVQTQHLPYPNSSPATISSEDKELISCRQLSRNGS